MKPQRPLIVRMRFSLRHLAPTSSFLFASALLTSRLAGQGAVRDLAVRLSGVTAVTGYEQQLVDTLLTLLPGSVRDRAGNAVLVLGSGEPKRLVVCPLDEPGYVVGGIREDGYLTLRRVSGRPVGPLFDQQLEGQRVMVFGRKGAVPGVIAVRSVHLTRGRTTADDPFTVDNAFVDLGAITAGEVALAGVGVLSPVSLEKRPLRYGSGLLAAPTAGRRAACAALLGAAAGHPAVQGTVIVAFTVEHNLSDRGVMTLANSRGPFAETLMIDGRKGPFGSIAELIDSAAATTALGRIARWSLPTTYGDTPVESVSLPDVELLVTKLADWISSPNARDRSTPAMTTAVTAPVARPAMVGGAASPIGEAERVLAALVETYGVSGMEGPVRQAVQSLLPAWAEPEADTAGNLWLRLGHGDPVVVFVAHLDEIGFQVTGIRDDGTLEIALRGGFFSSLYEAEPALVHTGRGMIPGVFTPRDSVTGPVKRTPAVLRVDVGTTSRAETEALGIKVGHTVTMPKSYRRLLGSRATGRSFDDRVGVTAQILAVRGIDPARLTHTVIFIWSVREEIGLDGARVAARALGVETTRVHAIDTFVSSDSPLESPTFALAPLGKGAVARSLDNSSITPPALVDSLVALAKAKQIPLQVGTTNGGNDGSVFAEFGVPDVAIGWPLRYSHSPVEVVDLKDVVSLARLTRSIAESW